MDLPALKWLQILICKIAQAQIDWMDGVCENRSINNLLIINIFLKGAMSVMGFSSLSFFILDF